MRFFPVMVALAACGGGGSSDKVDIKIANSKLAAIRTGDTWKPITLDAAGETTLDVDGPTVVATVCDDGGFFNYYTLFLGPGIDDSERLDFSCSGVILADIEVTIAAPSTTTVFLSFSRNFQGNSIFVAPGTYDVIAVDSSMTPPRFEIRRDVAITAATTLTFNLATTGTPMNPVTIEATGLGADETPTRNTSFATARRTFAFVTATGANGWMFPPSALKDGDRQTVGVSTNSELQGSRSVRREVAGSETTVKLALPSYLTSVTAMPTSVAWQGGNWDGFYYGINSPNFDVLWDMSVFPEWSDAGGKIDLLTMPDPTTIPGWESRWNLGATTGFEWFFSASFTDEPESFSATRSGEL